MPENNFLHLQILGFKDETQSSLQKITVKTSSFLKWKLTVVKLFIHIHVTKLP